MKAEHVNQIILNSKSILESITSKTISLGKAFKGTSPRDCLGVAVIVGIIGDVKGQCMFNMSEATAKGIADIMMMGMGGDTFDEIARSAISELANMVMGNIATGLASIGLTIDITPPSLLTGVSTISTTTNNILVIPLILDTLGILNIEVAIKES